MHIPWLWGVLLAPLIGALEPNAPAQGSSPIDAQPVSPNLWDLKKLSKPPKFRWVDQSSPIRSLLYRNEQFRGRSTEVFAFYATPGSIKGDPSRDKNLPAIVLLHGGGGTAFAEWVWMWAKRGYAAIAMDLSGRRPSAPKFDPATGELMVVREKRLIKRTRLAHGGPEANTVAKFNNVGGDFTDDWQYHAVAAAIRAHSLVRSLKEVDAQRTAVTGISWGGYLTCLTASIDDRFKAAVPVYGCGFLYDGQSVQRRLIDILEPEKRRQWIRLYEPSAWLPRCRVPIFFVNGTNDKHYPLVSYHRSYNLVKGPRQLRIKPGMRHSHVHGWAPPEIGLFIDQHLRDGAPLPKLSEPIVENGAASVVCKSTIPVKSGALHFTTDHGPLLQRSWQKIAAKMDGESISAKVPGAATVWLFTVTDSRGAMVSTQVVFAD